MTISLSFCSLTSCSLFITPLLCMLIVRPKRFTHPHNENMSIVRAPLKIGLGISNGIALHTGKLYSQKKRKTCQHIRYLRVLLYTLCQYVCLLCVFRPISTALLLLANRTVSIWDYWMLMLPFYDPNYTTIYPLAYTDSFHCVCTLILHRVGTPPHLFCRACCH